MALDTTIAGSSADSYASIAEADVYFAARGVSAWTGSDETKEIALRRGTSYIENTYRGKWVGVRYKQAQALAWPRVGEAATWLVDNDNFPIPVTSIYAPIKNAAMEAALLHLSGATLEPVLQRGGRIKSISKGVGPLQKSVTYMDGAPARDQFTVIDGLLRGLVTGSGNVRLVRA